MKVINPPALAEGWLLIFLKSRFKKQAEFCLPVLLVLQTFRASLPVLGDYQEALKQQ